MDYKQQSNQGCLVVDLLYLFGIEPTRQKEYEILSDGLFTLRDNYTLGCVQAFLDRYKDKSVTIYVDNKYYLGVLRQWVTHPRISMVYQKNDATLFNSLEPPFIAYIDNNVTSGWTHLPHFVLAVGSTPRFYHIFDPWEGRVVKLGKQKLLRGVDLLRSHVKVCPFVIAASL